MSATTTGPASGGERLADEARAPRSSRKLLLALVGVAVSAGAIYLATRKISLHRVERSLADADYVWLIPSLVLTYLTLWLRALRWRLLFDDSSAVTRAQSLGAVNIGLAFNNILPSRAGEVPRVFALRRASGLSAFEVGTTIVVERVLDLFTIALIGALIWPWLPDRTWLDALGLVCVGVVAGFAVVVALVAVLRGHFERTALRWLPRLPLVSEERARSITAAVGAGGNILLRRGQLLGVIAFSVVIWAVSGLAGLTLLPAFNLHATVLAATLIMVAKSFAMTVPSTSGSIGVYEASVQAALVAFGVSSSTALSFGLVLHAVNFFPIIATGLIASWVMARGAPHPQLQAKTTS